MSSRRLRRGLAIVSGAALSLFVITLVATSYSSQARLRESMLGGMALDSEMRAAAIGYFLSERRNDVQDLARSAEVEAFFANRALKMTLEYGLAASLARIGARFDRLRAQKVVERGPIYDRVELLAPEGTVLAESGVPRPGSAPSPHESAGRAWPEVAVDPQSRYLVVRAAVEFRGEHVAQVLAWLAPATLAASLLQPEDGAQARRDFLLDRHDLLLLDRDVTRWPPPLTDVLRELSAGAPRVVPLGRDPLSREDVAVVRAPVPASDLSLVSVTPARDLLGPANTTTLLLAAGALPVVVLGAGLLLDRARRLNLALRARYAESSRRRGELEGRNTALQLEIRRREEVEHALRTQQGLLEQRSQELQRAIEETHTLAFYDSVTGLGNRTLFRECLRRSLARAQRRGQSVAVLFLDVDRFKRINDTLGHPAGDDLLKEVARRLEGCVRQADVVARDPGDGAEHCVSRQGGDEFTILLGDLDDPYQATGVARRVIDLLSRPIQVRGQEVVVTGSLGISLFPGDGSDPDTLIKNADTAMYSAKAQGRNRYQFYEPTMQMTAMHRLSLEGELRKALERNELRVYFQPQIQVESGRAVAVEALVRWQHPVRGMVPPADFISVAEETGLITPLTEWVIRAACAQGMEWRRRGCRPVRVAVNVSARQFGEPVYAAVERALRETGFPGCDLEVELTEGVLMENTAEASRVLSQLKALGARVSIDDFGTGYSSLAYLKAFPIDTLKIDRSFVRDLPGDPNSAAITRTIVAMARSLGLELVAEGVETEGQLTFLRALGCDLVQGYLFGRPAPAESLEPMLREASAPQPGAAA